MAQPSWDWTADLSIPSTYAAGKSVIDQLLDALRHAQWNEHEIFGVHLAVEEAVVNAIRHGNGLDPDKQVHVHFQLATDRLRVEVADEGSGFKPERLPDPTEFENIEFPCGRGVLLMRTFMSLVEYNDQGNRVVMEKERGENRASA
ncbi:MAG TPA: ATP-binding protein [Pirellulales bacterium]|jgi:serine/threonine-protein kinase RsbW|nr:ATP-binding protein [Pirellulales bacterium]